MNILFVSTKGPLPTNDGHSLRTYNILKNIAKKHDVYLCSFVKYKEEYCFINELEKICKKVVYIELPDNMSNIRMAVNLGINLLSSRPYVAMKYDNKVMREAIIRIISEYNIDVIHLDLLPLGCYMDILQGRKVLLNEHNIESSLLLRRVNYERNLLKKLYLNLQYKRLKLFESDILNSVDHIVVCSEQDREIALSLSPESIVTVVPNGVDVEYFLPSVEVNEDDNMLVFVGGMNWFPNLDALEWFDTEIFPKILNVRPDTYLNVVGRGEEYYRWKHPDNVKILGYVDDIRSYLEKAAVFIAPLRVGGGTRLKILDAMSMQKAVVSTNIGSEGLNVTANKNIVIADDVNDFADSVIKILDNKHYRNNLGLAARKLIEKDYRWEILVDNLVSIYESMVNIRTIV